MEAFTGKLQSSEFKIAEQKKIIKNLNAVIEDIHAYSRLARYKTKTKMNKKSLKRDGDGNQDSSYPWVVIKGAKE